MKSQVLKDAVLCIYSQFIDVFHQNSYLEIHTNYDGHEVENEKISANYLFEFYFSRKLKHLF